MNLLFHSLFRLEDLVMNYIQVAMGRDTYPYLTMLLSYGAQAKDTYITCMEGWAMDEVGELRPHPASEDDQER